MDDHRGAQSTSRVTANPARDGPLVTGLVTRARSGDKQAWNALVERYAPLVWSICGRYWLSRADAEDVGQGVWLRLVDQLDKIRDPAALPGWLAVTTRRECGRVLGTARRLRPPVYAPDIENLPDGQADPADRELLTAERHAALREAFSRLPPDGQQLIAMLITDPPVPYSEISARLGIPVGSIGQKRSRCLDKLRRDPAISALINAACDLHPAARPAASDDLDRNSDRILSRRLRPKHLEASAFWRYLCQDEWNRESLLLVSKGANNGTAPG
jgi:RNA polymerase sigma factor (sigma-70 family)